MARPVVLSNGQVFVGLDENGLVHDFYYPYVGLDNLANARKSAHKIGLWIDGKFSWTENTGWVITTDFDSDALVSSVQMRSDALKVVLEFRDFVDSEHNAFVRCVAIRNLAEKAREIRLFMHQVFEISRAGRGDTAMYVPDDNYILDYKGRCCLLIGGRQGDGSSFDQYSVGNYGIEGKEGTFVDAEDGELTNNPIEHGGVDSVIRFVNRVEPGQSTHLDYWVVAADSQSDAQIIHEKLMGDMADQWMHSTRQYWHNWLQTSDDKLSRMGEADRRLTRKSMMVVKAHCDARGSILASGDSSIFNYGRDYYCYCWPRDAAYAMWPLLRLGEFDEARKFFEFARDTMHPDGYLMHKYQPDRAIGSTWHPLVHGRAKELAIQEDETAIVVYMMGLYYKATKDKAFLESFYETFIAKAAQFMSEFVDEATGLPHASYDLWEEKFLTNTYTVSTVIAALEVASELATEQNHPDDAVYWQKIAGQMRQSMDALYHPDGYFRKGFLLQPDGSLAYDDTLDISSLYGPLMFANFDTDDPRMVGTLKAVEQKLHNATPIGGVIRYEGDTYFRDKKQYSGNPWIVCSLWLAQYYQVMGLHDKASQLLDWAKKRAYSSGIMSEQFDPVTGFSLGVAPLVWSHAEFINTALDLMQRPESKKPLDTSGSDGEYILT
ncbi:glycoside hydrolase family 15 protein [Candidatus Saccharibacteria bacterium]|nr:glycoside hydrolase family 15 protein [Candidatus Saccharibacteria bacterium]